MVKPDRVKSQFNSKVNTTPPSNVLQRKQRKDTQNVKRSFVVRPLVFNHHTNSQKENVQTRLPQSAKSAKSKFRDDKSEQREKLAQHGTKKCLFHGCNNKQGNAFRNKVLDRRPSALQRSKQQQKCFPQFFYPTQQPTKHSTRQG